MNAFIVRVELHAATSDDYTVLHSEMEKVGFKRTIFILKSQISQQKVEVKLPTGEYYKENGRLTAIGILDEAKLCADKTGKKYSITSAKIDGNLEVFNL